jgi:hypothetical protein
MEGFSFVTHETGVNRPNTGKMVMNYYETEQASESGILPWAALASHTFVEGITKSTNVCIVARLHTLKFKTLQFIFT